MRTSRILALVAALVVLAAACGGGSDNSSESAGSTSTTGPATTQVATTTTPPTTAPVPQGGVGILGLHIEKVVFGADGYVQITTTGETAVSLEGLWLVQSSDDVPLSGSIAAGATLRISAADLGGLSSDGGEAALYKDRQFDSPTSIFDYVAWGSGGQRGGVAAQAGIWPQGVTVSAPTDFIELGGAPGDPEAWG